MSTAEERVREFVDAWPGQQIAYCYTGNTTLASNDVRTVLTELVEARAKLNLIYDTIKKHKLDEL